MITAYSKWKKADNIQKSMKKNNHCRVILNLKERFFAEKSNKTVIFIDLAYTRRLKCF